VIRLTLAWRPLRPLAGHDLREPVEVFDDAAIDRLVEREQPRLMGQQLAHRDPFLTLLSELRPIATNSLVVVEPAPRMGQRNDHRRQTLGRRVDDRHRVFLPRLGADSISHTAPQVDDLLAVMVDAASTTYLTATRKIFDEGLANRLECAAYVTMNNGQACARVSG
jgi:hypothetical protein